MDILAPVSTIMTSKLHTVAPQDSLLEVKKLFDSHHIHHVPVVRFKEIIGIVSKSDFLYFLRGFSNNDMDKLVDDSRLHAYRAEDIMTIGMAKVNPSDRINVALEVFKENRFHAIPVVNDDNELEGIVTTYDIIKKLSEQ